MKACPIPLASYKLSWYRNSSKGLFFMFPVAPKLYCPGIAVPATSPQIFELAGHHEISIIPGGAFVMGSADLDRAISPRWVRIARPFGIGVTNITVAQFFADCERPKELIKTPPNHPATFVSHDSALEYLKRFGFILPPDPWWEKAARGPAVNIQERMKTELGHFCPDDVVDFVNNRFENFVFKVGQEIYTDPTSQPFQNLIREGRPFWGWHVYGTASGRLDPAEAWYNKPYGRDESTGPADYGEANGYGVKGMTGNVSEWVSTWYPKYANFSKRGGFLRMIRGGSFLAQGATGGSLRVSARNFISQDGSSFDVGFRAAIAL